MSISYYENNTNWIYGKPDPGDPATRAALQEAAALKEQTFTTKPGYVPQSYQSIPMGNPPIVGWTVQNSTGSPFRPYAPTGTTPDWTSDVNPVGAGAYDMNPVVNDGSGNPLGRGPVGSMVFDGYSDSGDVNPNFYPEDQGGQLDPLEY